MAKSRFKITRFSNPSGQEVYRVSGTLNGQRIRKNFLKYSDAVAEKQKLEIRHLNEASEGQTVFTTLTHEQNRDAIAATSLLREAGLSKSLSFAARFLIEHYHEAEEAITVENAVKEYLTEKKNESGRGIISPRQYRSISGEMATFQKVFTGRLTNEILADDINDYLSGKQPGTREAASQKTWNNRLWYLSTFFKFCLSRKYASETPITGVRQFKIKKSRGTAETLSARQAEALMHWLEAYQGEQNKDGQWWNKPGCMVPYFALTLFAGIRPDWRNGEISKLEEKDIRLDTGVILIEPGASKNNEKRTIKLQPNLQLWLEKYPVSEYPIVRTKRFEEMWAQVRERFSLPHDVLRHTYISMTVGAFRSVGDTALQAGNSEAIIRQHYLDLKSEAEADAFWRIVPQGMALPASMEKRDGRYIDAHK